MSGRQERVGGVLGDQPQPQPFDKWQKDMKDSWFDSFGVFMVHVVMAPLIFPQEVHDHLGLRAAAVFCHYGLVQVPRLCPVCKKPAILRSRRSSTPPHKEVYAFTCSASGHKHFETALNNFGLLKRINFSSWLPFLMMLVMTRGWQKIADVHDEIQRLCGNFDRKTLLIWMTHMQESLKKACLEMDVLRIGSKGSVVVIDETEIGFNKDEDGEAEHHKSVNKRVPRKRATPGSRKRTGTTIKKVLPARTVYKRNGPKPMKAMRKIFKRPAAMKSVYNKNKQGTHKDRRSNATWLWVGVLVGKGKEVYTHDNGKKKVTFRMLPRKSEAMSGKSRGFHEIKDTIKTYIKPQSKLVFDKWSATVSAVRALGYEHAPPVNHTVGWRDYETGFHTNDVESENNRIKGFVRRRYGKLVVKELDLFEYTFQVNQGSSFKVLMDGLAVANGGAQLERTLRF